MRGRLHLTRWIALAAGAVVIGAAVPAAPAGAGVTPTTVTITTPANKTTAAGIVHMQIHSTGVAFDEVAFSLSKSKKGRPQILLLEVFDETSPGVWDFEWDSTQIANGKYYVQPLGLTPDEIVITGTSVLLTTKNPVLKVSPATQKAGKNVSLHLTNAPEHGTTPATAVGRFCAGAAPVTAADFATRCDPASERVSKPYKKTSVAVSVPVAAGITEPGDGVTHHDCVGGDCSVAISTNGLVISRAINVKP